MSYQNTLSGAYTTVSSHPTTRDNLIAFSENVNQSKFMKGYLSGDGGGMISTALKNDNYVDRFVDDSTVVNNDWLQQVEQSRGVIPWWERNGFYDTAGSAFNMKTITNTWTAENNGLDNITGGMYPTVYTAEDPITGNPQFAGNYTGIYSSETTNLIPPSTIEANTKILAAAKTAAIASNNKRKKAEAMGAV